MSETGDGGRVTRDGVEETGEQAAPTRITRRRALQVLGTVPVAAALDPGLLAQQPKPLQPAVTSQVPAGPTAAAPAAPAAGPRFFNNHEWKTLRSVVDYIIPRDERSGSATEAKVPEYIDFLLSEKDANVNTQVQFHGGLAWIDTEIDRNFDRLVEFCVRVLLDESDSLGQCPDFGTVLRGANSTQAFGVERLFAFCFFGSGFFLFACAIAFSRVYLHVHYASDVIAGFCLCIVWLGISFWIMRFSGRAP